MKKSTFRRLVADEIPFFMSLPAYVWVLAFFYVPLVLVCVRSVVHVVPDSWISLSAYASFFSATHMAILKNSLFLACNTAILSLLIAYPIAYYVALLCRAWLKSVLLFLLTVPFAVNVLVQAYAWFFVLENDGLINSCLRTLGIINHPIQFLYTPFAVMVVMVYCYLPFMIMPIYTALEKIDVRLLEASYDLGATWWQTFCKIIVPLSVPGVRIGLLLVFIASFGEFVIPALIGGSKMMFVGSLISYYFLTVDNNAFGSAFTCFSGLVVLLVVLFVLWRARGPRGNRGADL